MPLLTQVIISGSAYPPVSPGCQVSHRPGELGHPASQNVGVGEPEVRAWLRSVMVEHAGFSEAESESVVVGALMDPEWARDRIGEAATVAYATPLLPGGKGWWDSEGQIVKDRLLAGGHEYQRGIEERVAEAVSSAPDTWDPNWPEDKTFWAVDLPPSSRSGQTFIAGNGMGTHGQFRVEERAGKLGAVLIESWSVLADEDERAQREADRVFFS